MYFSVDCAYVVGVLQKRTGLRKFAHIADVPSVDNVYCFMSRFDEEQFVSFVSGVLNSLCIPRKRRRARTILIDSTAITLDLNWFKRTISKAQLATRDFDWGYSKTHGHYIGYKLTLAIEYPSLKPLCFHLHRGSPHDAPLFDDIVLELRKRRIARIGDLIVCDKGYYSFRNCTHGIREFKIVPLIFSKKNFNREKLMQNLSYPLSIFGRSDTDETMKLFKNLVNRLLDSLGHQDCFQSIRSLIEDVFKLAKDSFSLQKFHRYTTRSVKKAVSLNVLFIRARHFFGISRKEAITAVF